MIAQAQFQKVISQCKVNDIVFVSTDYSQIYGRVKNVNVSVGWIEIGITEEDSVILSMMDVNSFTLIPQTSIIEKQKQQAKWLEFICCKYDISIYDSAQKQCRKDYEVLSQIAEIWNRLLDYEKERVLSIFKLDDEGMNFILSKLNNQYRTIKVQQEKIEKISTILNKDSRADTDNY